MEKTRPVSDELKQAQERWLAAIALRDAEVAKAKRAAWDRFQHKVEQARADYMALHNSLKAASDD